MEIKENPPIQTLQPLWAKLGVPTASPAQDNTNSVSFAKLLNMNTLNISQSDSNANDAKTDAPATKAESSPKTTVPAAKKTNVTKADSKEIAPKKDVKDVAANNKNNQKADNKDNQKQENSAASVTTKDTVKTKMPAKEAGKKADKADKAKSNDKEEEESVSKNVSKRDANPIDINLDAPKDTVPLAAVVEVAASPLPETTEEVSDKVNVAPEAPETLASKPEQTPNLAEVVPVQEPKATKSKDDNVAAAPKAEVKAEVENKDEVAPAPKVEAKADTENKDEVTKQVAKLSEVIGSDKKVKMEVTVSDTPSIKTEAVAVKPEIKEVTPIVEPKVKEVVHPKSNEAIDTANINMVNNKEPISVNQAPAAQTVSAPIAEAASSDVATDDVTNNISSLSNTMTAAPQMAAAEVNVPRMTLDTASNDKASFREVYKGMSQEVVDQVKVNITKSAVKGVDKIDIQLKPENLGKVEINLHIDKEGKLQAHISSSRSDTLEALQRDSASLEKALNDAGFNTENGSLSFSLREDQNQQQQKDLRTFMGEALKVQEENTAENLPEMWDGKSALNIRV